MGRPPRYTAEFRQEAVRLVQTSGQSMRQIASDLGITNHTLGIWVREADGRRAPAGPLSGDERTELIELRRRVKILESEREILRKAAAFFAQEAERIR